MPPKVGTRFVDDVAHYRTGWLLEEELTKMLLKQVSDAKAVIHKDQVAKKVALTPKMILDQIDILRGAIMIAYPAYHGLGVWEPARIIFEAQDNDPFYNQEGLEVNRRITEVIVTAGGDGVGMVRGEGDAERKEVVRLPREEREDDGYR